MPARIAKSAKPRASGNLRIGDQWNAITIIALSQSNPLKAVAELVENSIDAHAKSIVITRGKEKGRHYLRVKDDGEGVRRNADGEPDFQYVATHVCDSVKRQLKAHGAAGLQGEFGIGLLSFRTLGEELLLTSAANDGPAGFRIRGAVVYGGDIADIERHRGRRHGAGADHRCRFASSKIDGRRFAVSGPAGLRVSQRKT